MHAQFLTSGACSSLLLREIIEKWAKVLGENDMKIELKWHYCITLFWYFRPISPELKLREWGLPLHPVHQQLGQLGYGFWKFQWAKWLPYNPQWFLQSMRNLYIHSKEVTQVGLAAKVPLLQLYAHVHPLRNCGLYHVLIWESDQRARVCPIRVDSLRRPILSE